MNSETCIEIVGGKKLSGGKVQIAGSSNQVTKCIIAALLTDEPVVIKGAPDVDERRIVQEMFVALGGLVEELDATTLRLSAKKVDKSDLAEELCKRNRIAILTAGPLLWRLKDSLRDA